MKKMQQLLPGMVLGAALYFLVTNPSEAAQWVGDAGSWLGDVFDSLLEFFKQLVE
jgi:hypothetical protein